MSPWIVALEVPSADSTPDSRANEPGRDSKSIPEMGVEEGSGAVGDIRVEGTVAATMEA